MGIVRNTYMYWSDLAHLASAAAGYGPSRFSGVPPTSPVVVDYLAFYLASHPDQRFALYVLDGLRHGFRIGVSSPVELRSSCRNHSSSGENHSIVTTYINTERAAGRMSGPLLGSRGVHVSPIGLVPKGSQPGAWRMIVDLSHPSLHSVNDAISPELCSLHYPSVDDAVQYILSLGVGTKLIKIDLKSAYRILPVHPADQHLLGVNWDDAVWVDLRLPFGLRSAPKLFTAFADAVAWSIHVAGVKFLIHYLDDFLIFCPPGRLSDPDDILHLALRTLFDLRIPVAFDKLEGPATTVTFLGILIDTQRMELRLPLVKLIRLRDHVSGWCDRRSGLRSQFESLLGQLSQAAIVLRPGRIFLRHLFTILSRCPRDHRFIHLDSVARADLAWWSCFLVDWHGTTLFSPSVQLGPRVFTDASGSFGCGAVAEIGAWLQVTWPESWRDIDISVKEMVPIVLAAASWGPVWSGHHIHFMSDNLAVVAVLQKRSCKDPLMLHLLRCMYFYAAYYHFTYSACHLPGTAADALSRGNMSLFRSLFPQGQQTIVNSQVLELLVLRRPNWGSHACIQRLLSQSLAPATLRSYRTALAKYLTFCSQYMVTPPFPLSESVLVSFVASLSATGLAYASIRAYLSGLRFFQVLYGFPDPASSVLQSLLGYVLRGVRRSNAGVRRPPRLPITPNILRLLHAVWSHPPASWEKAMLWVACCTGFFGFLRTAEFTCPSRQAFATTSTLSYADVAVDSHVNPSFVTLRLKSSKTDIFGVGATVYLSIVDGPLCPVKSLLHYLALRGPSPGPLFILSDGTPLSRVKLVAAVRSALEMSGIHAAGFNGHSFRIGAATAAAAAGLEDSLIRQLGRWRSDAFLAYIRVPQSTLLSVSSRLVPYQETV